MTPQGITSRKPRGQTNRQASLVPLPSSAARWGGLSTSGEYAVMPVAAAGSSRWGLPSGQQRCTVDWTTSNLKASPCEAGDDEAAL
jgi:hypothetical protein